MTKLRTRVVTRGYIECGEYVTYKELAAQLSNKHSHHDYGDNYIHDMIREMKSVGKINDGFQWVHTCKLQGNLTRYISPRFAEDIITHWKEKQQKKRQKSGPKERGSLRQTESKEATSYFDNLHKPRRATREFFVAVSPGKTGRYVRPKVQKKNLHFVFKARYDQAKNCVRFVADEHKMMLVF